MSAENHFQRNHEDSRTIEELYRSLLNSSADAIVIYDTEWRVKYVNRSFTRMFGWTLEELRDRHLPYVPDSEEERTYLASRRLITATVPCAGFETRRCTKDGKMLEVRTSASLYSDHQGNPSGTLVILTDITEKKTAERDLKEALASATELRLQAEAANRAKSQFLANVSHELRTPLTAIIGFSEILEDKAYGDLNEVQRSYLGYILSSGRHLLRLINDILDLSKIESGKMELNLGDVDLARQLENSLLMIRQKALKRRLALNLHIADELQGIAIRADEVKLKQILFNLLSNAAKFTPDGGTISLKTWTDANILFISVSDTGIGIDDQDRERILLPFEQVSQACAGEQSGTGLGLALTKSLVELHGGSITVESSGVGKGSTFTFTLPLS